LLLSGKLAIVFDELLIVIGNLFALQVMLLTNLHPIPSHVPEFLKEIVYRLPRRSNGIIMAKLGRDIQAKNGFGEVDRWKLMAMVPGLLQATNPKDYIYGLMGVVNLQIRADYNIKTPVSRVYMDFISTWLKERRRILADLTTPEEDGFPEELFFLEHAGLLTSVDNLDYPSWIPNYDVHYSDQLSAFRDSVRRGRVELGRGKADSGVFPPTSPPCQIVGQTL
jgi:hypothetical protein